jgi:hypothetical protein
VDLAARRVCVQGLGDGRQFFFEKKNQKTFVCLLATFEKTRFK